MNASELTGDMLDYWIAKALGYKVNATENEVGYTQWITPENLILCYSFEPSRDWSQGGQIIEKEGISTCYTGHAGDHAWFASIGYPTKHVPQFCGPTPLIAAMRAFVASKLGDEIEIQDNLIRNQS